MILLLFYIFAKESHPKTHDSVTNTKEVTTPPPSDLYSSIEWCPVKAELCVTAAASEKLGFVDMRLEFTLSPKSYVAIGFGGEKMTDADMLVITSKKVKSKTVIVAEDYYSKGFSLPKKDKQQDYSIIAEGTKPGGRYTIILRRKIDTGDTEDKVFNTNGSFEMIWARGKISGKTLKKHDQAGALPFVMQKFEAKPTADASGTENENTALENENTAVENDKIVEPNSTNSLQMLYSAILMFLL
eukprot:NODE_1047_length_1714_cov_1.037152.p1 type:complete len:243 gc:universal NODE_1047_length_1714_cov_1.037152:1600-872(-)